MYRKTLTTGILLLFLGSVLFPIAIGNNIEVNTIEKFLDDQIDQQQTLWEGGGVSNHNPNLFAQSFKPSLNTLTRIQIIAGRDGNPTGPVYLHLRSSLDGVDIASVMVNAEDLQVYSDPFPTWIEFNFGAIPVTSEETYYYIWDNQASEEHGSVVKAYHNVDVYDRGSAWIYSHDQNMWYEEFADIQEFVFITYGYHEDRPDLFCEGSLSWIDVSPGSTQQDIVTIENIGDPGTLLNWEVDSYPDWGTWTFAPESGIGLLAGTSATIDVTVIAPDKSEETFTGDIVFINSDDPNDFCIIPVSLTTPFVKPMSAGNTYYVGGSGSGNYSSIQSAINAASDGDTVFVYDDSSPYNEILDISKSISLIGENTDTTSIVASYNDVGIFIDADNIQLMGFTLVNGYLGIYGQTSNSELSSLIIYPDFLGIDLEQSSNNIFTDIIIDGQNGYRAGMILQNDCDRNTISNIQIFDTILGLRLSGSNGNKIINNEFTNNDVYGLEIYFGFLNVIRDNNFISNGVQSYFDNSAFNLWWGNYWNDWTSADRRPIEGVRFGPILQNKQNFTTYDWHPAQEPYDIT